MDKIKKALSKLSTKERDVVKSILIKLDSGQLLGIDIQKLKSHKDIYRVRKGSIRIIYRQTDKARLVLAIEKRSEKTYRNY